ncbi:MAG: carboxypeptidase-like regulatory domain-containing protein [Myxococcota bacterium]|nr:carboxypeptidase-like regulatory domain-containing protein [Myxococcota bacterium]
MRYSPLIALSVLALTACPEKEPADDTAADTGVDMFAALINTTDPLITEDGSEDPFTCWAADATTWVSDTLEPKSDCQQDASVTGEVKDFETDDPVEEATVEIFLADTIPDATSADQSALSDVTGRLTFDETIPTCTPFTYRVSTDPARDETVVTIDAHQVYGPGTSKDEDFQSVSTATYAIIPSLLGVTIDDTKGSVAGTAYDCNGNPIQGAQVIVRDSDGNYPESQVVRYFENEFPVRNRTTTSEDGLWVLLNVPPGRSQVVELYGVMESGEPQLLATSVVDVFADSLNISSTTTGDSDGVVYPSDCVVDGCGEVDDDTDSGS